MNDPVIGHFNKNRLIFDAFEKAHEPDPGIRKHGYVARIFRKTLQFTFTNEIGIEKKTYLNKSSALKWLDSKNQKTKGLSNKEIAQLIKSVVQAEEKKLAPIQARPWVNAAPQPQKPKPPVPPRSPQQASTSKTEIPQTTPPSPPAVSNSIRGKFIFSASEASFTKKGIKIAGSDEPKERVLLDELGDDPRFAIEVKDNSTLSEEQQKDLIHLNVGGREVSVDSKEVALRLHLSLDLVKEAADKGKLASLFSDKKEKILLLQNIVTNYARIFEKSSKTQGSERLRPDALMKVVRTAFKNEALTPGQKGKGMLINDNFLRGKQILAGFKGDKLLLVNITHQMELCRGGFGIAFKVQSVSTQRDKVIKYLKDFDNIESIRNELNLLTKIHNSFPGGLTGIQKPPYTIIEFTNEEGEKKVGLLMTKYDNDVFEGFKSNTFNNLNVRLDGFEQVLTGLENCYRKIQLVHRDIKPENVFYKRTTGGKVDFYLADFGDAKLLSDKDSDLSRLAGSPECMSQNDVNMFFDLLDDNNTEEIKKLLAKADVFAMGLLCFDFLVNGRETPFDAYNEKPSPPYPKDNAKFNRSCLTTEVRGNAGIEFANLIQRALDKDYKKRPTLTEFLKQYQAIRKKHHI